jgi:ribosome-binding factor A
VSQRIRRINETIRSLIAERVPTLKDPRIGFVTVTDVRTLSDLSQAEVFFTVLPDDEEALFQTQAGLDSAAPLLRREIGAALRVRRTPELVFTHDPVPAQGRRIEALLRETAQADAAAGRVEARGDTWGDDGDDAR